MSQVCRVHADGSTRCFDQTGWCEAPVVVSDEGPETVETVEEVEVPAETVEATEGIEDVFLMVRPPRGASSELR